VANSSAPANALLPDFDLIRYEPASGGPRSDRSGRPKVREDAVTIVIVGRNPVEECHSLFDNGLFVNLAWESMDDPNRDGAADLTEVEIEGTASCTDE
jgi:hypothetical protein